MPGTLGKKGISNDSLVVVDGQRCIVLCNVLPFAKFTSAAQTEKYLKLWLIWKDSNG